MSPTKARTAELVDDACAQIRRRLVDTYELAVFDRFNTTERTVAASLEPRHELTR